MISYSKCDVHVLLIIIPYWIFCSYLFPASRLLANGFKYNRFAVCTWNFTCLLYTRLLWRHCASLFDFYFNFALVFIVFFKI